MLNVAPKEMRENIARANGYLRRNEVPRAMQAMSTALRQFAGVKLMRAARAEMDIQITDFLKALVRHQAMQPLLDPQQTGKPRKLPYQLGKEAALATVLDGLAKILRDEAENAVKRKVEARVERKKTLIQTGVQLLQTGQIAKGRAFLKRVAEEFKDEKGICVQLGQIFVAVGQHVEAAEMYEAAIQAQPRDGAGYIGAVNSWLALHEYEKAEKVYKAVLRTFGGHPSTFGKMAKLYLLWHKRELAEEFATRALQGDSRQADALAVMETLNRR
ncbi:MAG: tetratricopeptide repeat protein [Desulfovibrio sp.]|nr:tetratricopeptide repeat protein [Desulfovibrio sp.]